MAAAGDNARIRNHANLIWGVAELLRGDYKRADYGKVILPLAVRRAPTPRTTSFATAMTC